MMPIEVFPYDFLQEMYLTIVMVMILSAIILKLLKQRCLMDSNSLNFWMRNLSLKVANGSRI